MNVGSKVLLFGEYTVLNNGVALTIPFDKFSGELCFPDENQDEKSSEESHNILRNFTSFITSNPELKKMNLDVKAMVDELSKGVFFKSDIPQGYGLGSSGAVVAAIFERYYNKARSVKNDLKEISKDKLHQLRHFLGELESYFHGSSSGIDPLTIFVNEPLLFRKSKVQKVDLPAFNENGEHTIFLIDTGKERNTKKLVDIFNSKMKCSKFESAINKDLVNYTNNCIEALIQNDTSSLYSNLSKLAHCQLEHLDHLIPEELTEKVAQGIKSEDYFIKICGAGGGGYLLGFTSKWEKVQEQFKDYQLEILHKF